jgi:hypothetical protein
MQRDMNLVGKTTIMPTTSGGNIQHYWAIDFSAIKVDCYSYELYRGLDFVGQLTTRIVNRDTLRCGSSQAPRRPIPKVSCAVS